MPEQARPRRHSDEMRDWVASLWQTGHSAGEIERMSNGQITRSAVCGLVNRMGLHRETGRGAAQRPQAPKFKSPLPPRIAKPSRTVTVKAAADLPPLPIDERDCSRPCQCPSGDPLEGLFCGRPRDPSDWQTPYCRDHRAIAVRPQKGGAIRLRDRPVPDLSRIAVARPFRFPEAAPR